MSEKPRVQELHEIAKERLSMLTYCCGFSSSNPCRNCVASKKIVLAWQRYEEQRLLDWPDEISECEICGSLEKVGKMAFGNDPDPLTLDLCESCHADKDGFKEWLCKSIKQELDESPDYELQPNGTYKFIGTEEEKPCKNQ